MLETTLVIATLLSGLVAGLLFGFAVVAMPGINALSDREYLRSFQAMDRVIQNNQPLFMVAWIGSVVALVASALLGLGQLEGTQLGLLLAATAIYLGGVQAPTAIVNIPLNNRVQQVDTRGATDQEAADQRRAFEPRWNRWNGIRTLLATTTTVLLLIVLVRM